VGFQRIVGVSFVDNIRVTFSKTDRAKYISHLDLNRAMQRAIKRARIPIWYTEGFNPHAYIMFPLALSLGVNSHCELMDLTITVPMTFDEIKDKLNAVLPDGLKVNKVAFQEKKHTEIVASEYKIYMKTELSAEETLQSFSEFLSLEKIEVEKRTKKKSINLVDIKPLINVFDMTICEDEFCFFINLPAGTQSNINTALVTDAFSSIMGVKIESISIERTKILAVNGEIFI